MTVVRTYLQTLAFIAFLGVLMVAGIAPAVIGTMVFGVAGGAVGIALGVANFVVLVEWFVGSGVERLFGAEL